MFEWQKHSQDKMEEVPHYRDILEFIDLRTQASETSVTTSTKKKFPAIGKAIASFTANSESNNSHCVLCTSERHPCPKFKSMSRIILCYTMSRPKAQLTNSADQSQVALNVAVKLRSSSLLMTC